MLFDVLYPILTFALSRIRLFSLSIHYFDIHTEKGYFDI